MTSYWDSFVTDSINAIHPHLRSMPTLTCARILIFSVVGMFAIIVFSLLRIIYNITLHPLRKFPGPKLWASSRLTWVYYTFKGDVVIRLKHLHDEYGPVIRVAPDELSFIDAAAWHDIYSGTGVAQLPRDPYIFPPEMPELPGDLIHANAIHHHLMRRHVAYAFSHRALEEQAPVINSHIDVLIGHLHGLAKGTESVNIADWLTFTSLDIIASLAYGPGSSAIACLPTGKYSNYAAFLLDAFKGGFFISTLNRYRLLPIVMQLLPKEMTRKRKEFMALSIAMTDKRLAEADAKDENESPDFFTYMLKADKADRTLTYSEMVVNASIFMIAGSESTATLITGTLLYLMRDKKCMTRLCTEIRSSFKTEDEITISSVAKLTYMLACLEEGLRMVTPAPFGMARRTVAPKMIAGVMVPKGTSVSVGQYAAWHSDRNFVLAEDFLPERWLDNGGEHFSHDDKAGFHPFSVGSRNCIGKNLAYVEMRLILSRLIWNFDFELLDRSFKWTRQKAFIVWEKEPLMVKVTSVR